MVPSFEVVIRVMVVVSCIVPAVIVSISKPIKLLVAINVLKVNLVKMLACLVRVLFEGFELLCVAGKHAVFWERRGVGVFARVLEDSRQVTVGLFYWLQMP